MVKLSSNPTCVLSDADVITNEQAERIAKVLTKHLPGAGDVTEAGKILGVDANGDVALVEDKTGSTYTAGEGLTLENGQFSVDNPMPGASGASQGDVLTVGANGPEWAAVPKELPASLGSAGQVLTVNSGATGVEWASAGGGSSNVEIISLLSNSPPDLDIFAAMVHDAYAAGKVVVAKLEHVDAEHLWTMYMPMTRVLERTESKQYFFGAKGMWYSNDDYGFHPADFYMGVYIYDGDSHYSVTFKKNESNGTSWSPF